MGYSAALIILYDSEKRLLLQQRTNDARFLPGHWAFFGGEIEKAETPESAVRREAREEINCILKCPKFARGQEFQEGQTKGYLYIFTEKFMGDKAGLSLNEGQNWGWFDEKEIKKLKMIERDRDIIRHIVSFINKTAV